MSISANDDFGLVRRPVSLPIDPLTFFGVVLVVADCDRLTVTFSDSSTAIVERSPLAYLSGEELFDVWLPSTRLISASDVIVSKNQSEVLAILANLANSAFRRVA